MAKHLLVDLENVQPAASAVADWMSVEGKAWIFYGPHQHKLLAAFQALGDRVTLIPISRPGANSLDFHLVFYLGYLAAGNPKSEFTVLAKDTGYDPAIAHARLLTFAVKRMAALASVAAKSVAGSSTKLKAQMQPTLAINGSAAPKKIAAKKVPVAKRAAQAKMTSVKASPPAKTASKAAPPTATTPTMPKAVTISRKLVTASAGAALVASPMRAAPVAKPPVAKRSAVKPTIAIYRDVLAELRTSNRPGSLLALERRIQSRIGPTASPAKVQTVIDHLKTTDAIRLVQGQLVYFPDDPSTVLTKR